MIIETRTPARAGLIGNPSDGFNGVTISFTFDAFFATVKLWESPQLEILPWQMDSYTFNSVEDLVLSATNYGYYGGLRLLKATIKVFYDYCQSLGISLDHRNFTLAYSSNIPVRVGLAGSSGIITSAMRALMQFYGVTVPKETLPNLILKAESEELKIGAGLQDRVVQVYGGLVYMDFDQELMQRGFGQYENLPSQNLPPLFIAYDDSYTEGTEVFHNPLRERYQRGDPEVISTINAIADCARQFRPALEKSDLSEMTRLVNENLELRCRIQPVSSLMGRLIKAAKDAGAAVKLAGSQGAVVGIYQDEEMYRRLEENYRQIGAKLLKPKIIGYPFT